MALEVTPVGIFGEWALVPIAYRLGSVGVIEWDGVRIGLGTDGRWWSVGSGLSLVLAPTTI